METADTNDNFHVSFEASMVISLIFIIRSGGKLPLQLEAIVLSGIQYHVFWSDNYFCVHLKVLQASLMKFRHVLVHD